MVLEALIAYKWTFLFYLGVVVAIYLLRHKLDWPARFIGLYRTQIGLKLMKRLGRHERTVKTLGYIGIVVGYIGMIAIVVAVIQQSFVFLLAPADTPPPAGLFLPGVPIPGTDFEIPLITGWIALLLVIAFHEFSHGVVACAHKVKVQSSGLMVFGPLGGAFVEPDEKSLAKKPKRVQLSIFAAGPFSNMLLIPFVFIFLLFVMTPLLGSFVADTGVVFADLHEEYPAITAGVQTGVVYNSVDGQSITGNEDFFMALQELEPGEDVVLGSAAGAVTVTAAGHPLNSSRGYLGVVLGENLKNPSMKWLYAIVQWLSTMLFWVMLISFLLGLANLLPVGPLDGGRMFKEAATHFFGEKWGVQIWTKVSIFLTIFLGVLIFITYLVVPFIK